MAQSAQRLRPRTPSRSRRSDSLSSPAGADRASRPAVGSLDDARGIAAPPRHQDGPLRPPRCAPCPSGVLRAAASRRFTVRVSGREGGHAPGGCGASVGGRRARRETRGCQAPRPPPLVRQRRRVRRTVAADDRGVVQASREVSTTRRCACRRRSSESGGSGSGAWRRRCRTPEPSDLAHHHSMSPGYRRGFPEVETSRKAMKVGASTQS